MTRLVAAGKPLDLITLSESIESRGKDALEQLGGFAYLAELSKTPRVRQISLRTVTLWPEPAGQGNWPPLALKSPNQSGHLAPILTG